MEFTPWNVNNQTLSCPTHLSTPINKKHNYFSFSNYPFQFSNPKSCTLTLLIHARKNKNNSEVHKPIITQQVPKDNNDDVDEGIGNDEVLVDDDDDEEFLDDGDYFEDEEMSEKAEVYAGDGAEGGGISLAGTWWDREALAIAEHVMKSFESDLGMYAFRTLVNATIQVRVEKLSTKSGSPSMSDIEAFSTAYRARLDDAELAKTTPENISLEVSSPGVERVIRIPQDFDRFKERPVCQIHH